MHDPRKILFDMEEAVTDVINLAQAATVIATYGADHHLEHEDASGLLTLLNILRDRARSIEAQRCAGLDALGVRVQSEEARS